jgi:hypothetical protein
MSFKLHTFVQTLDLHSKRHSLQSARLIYCADVFVNYIYLLLAFVCYLDLRETLFICNLDLFVICKDLLFQVIC